MAPNVIQCHGLLVVLWRGTHRVVSPTKVVLRVVGCSLAEVWLGTHRVASSSRAQSRVSQGLVGFSEHDNVQGATESGFFIVWRGVHQGFLISPISAILR